MNRREFGALVTGAAVAGASGIQWAAGESSGMLFANGAIFPVNSLANVMFPLWQGGRLNVVRIAEPEGAGPDWEVFPTQPDGSPWTREAWCREESR